MKYTLLLSSLTLLSPIASAQCATQTIHLEKGAPHIIKLESNPMTGYRWELTSLSNQSKIQVEELPYKFNIPCIHASGGNQSWKITAQSTGSTRAIFDYKRSWESTSLKTEIFDFIVG
jgi:predicted secreted protein